MERNKETKVRKSLSSQQEDLLKEEGEQEVNERGRKKESEEKEEEGRKNTGMKD